jgi:hypothetical protein
MLTDATTPLVQNGWLTVAGDGMSGWLRWSSGRVAGSSRADLGAGLGLAGQAGRGLVARLLTMRLQASARECRAGLRRG